MRIDNKNFRRTNVLEKRYLKVLQGFLFFMFSFIFLNKITICKRFVMFLRKLFGYYSKIIIRSMQSLDNKFAIFKVFIRRSRNDLI